MLHNTASRAITAGNETTATLPALMNQRAAADYLGVSTKWLERDRWVGASIPYVKIGRSVRYRADDLAAYVEANSFAAQGGAK
ncbi:MAG: helix-turn-helix domain-containing protein [Loktanella sp.]|nr:helix-turn-helix domain-containing protein [Loktanella sp.]